MHKAPALPRFLALYGALFAAFGVASPFLPGLLRQDGLSPAALGIVLAAGTAIRLAAGPLGGRLADRAGRPALVLAAFAVASAVVALGYTPARGLAALLAVSVTHAALLAPLTPVADALALGAAAAPGGFAYGWVRGAGSAAFIAGTLLSGQLVQPLGLGIIVWLNAALLALSAASALLLPDRLPSNASPHATPARPASATRPQARGLAPWRALFAVPGFATLMGAAALIGGSHALHDGFEVLRWRSAGLSAGQASVLWSLSVAAEIVMFLFAGRRLLTRFGPGGAITLAACAGIVRWSAAANTAAFSVMAVVEPLHGFTFALLHLACMDVIGRSVPKTLAATAQAFYATIAMGATAALITLGSGSLYGRFGAGAFWLMAALCALALPLAWRIRATQPASASA